MKDFTSIHENELDGALNALFLETYSRKDDEGLARFCMEQEYNVIVDPGKEIKLLARLNGKRGGGKNLLFLLLALLLVVLSFFFFNHQTAEVKIAIAPQQNTPFHSTTDSIGGHTTGTTQTLTPEEKTTHQFLNPITPLPPANDPQLQTPIDSAPKTPSNTSSINNEPPKEKELPYFDKEGLAYFAKVKEQVLQKLVKINDLLYAKTEPGATKYKNTEVTVPPFVMSNFPVTNLQYKTFLADLVMQGRVDDLKKCLPKTEIWKEYGCTSLAKIYFENESYNDFPVVNVNKEACALFCEWMQEETNKKLAEASPASKTKSSTSTKKKQVIVRLPYDYEWIYSADAAYTLIPNCGGYNTIYDASEGLVDKDFYKRTSQVKKSDLRKETQIDKLSDINRFGMTEAEMIKIFKEAMNFNPSSANSSDPASYPNNIESCCLAGHVCELIKNKDGDFIVRGCCWENKADYLKMLETYNKFGASPFVGFRVMIMSSERGSDKNPFW